LKFISILIKLFGLVSGLTNYEVLAKSGKVGLIFENLCLNEIRKAVSLTAHFPEIHFWRFICRSGLFEKNATT